MNTLNTNLPLSSHRPSVTLAAMMLLACLLVNLPWQSMLGTDTVIPEYAGWGVLGLLLLIIAGSKRRVFYRAPLLLLAFVLLSLPLLWMPADTDLWRALSRVVLLWCGGVFFLWWSAYPVSLPLTKQAACLLSLFGLVCAASVLLYVLWPQGFAHWLPVPVDHRPSGGFRQVNLMASFLATIIAVGLHGWLFSGRKRWLVCLALLMVAVTWTQSTVGLLGVVGGGVLMTAAGWRTVRGRMTGAWLVLGSSWALAKWGETVRGLPSVTHENGWAARLQMWRGAGSLWAEHPLWGRGYGMFEGAYPAGLARLHEIQMPGLNVVGHPHNELLYWISEGGLVAAVGCGLLLFWGGRIALRLWRQAALAGGYGRPGSDALGWGLCALPGLLHTQTEYPWYESPLHYVLFLFLAGMAVARLGPAVPATPRSRLPQRAITAGLALLGVGLLLCSLSGTVLRVAIDQSKQNMAADIRFFDRVRRFNPWFMPDQQRFVLNLHNLQQYNRDHNPARLAQATAFFQDYLIRHPDPNVYTMYIQALDLQGRRDKAQQVYDEGRWRVGWDWRFAPE